MAVILGCDGFDNGAIKVSGSNQGGEVSASTDAEGRKTGPYCLKLGDNGWVRYPITGTPANCSTSFWVQFGADVYTYNTTKIQFILSTGEVIELRWDPTNKTFDVYVAGVKVADGTIFLPSRTIFHVQFYAVIADAGSIGVKINGFTSISYSGDTLPVGAAAAVSYVKFFNDVNDIGIYFDDIVWGTGGFLGDLRCVDIRPNADTIQDDWTPSAGDNYSTIDETPASDADYNVTNVNANADQLALGDFDGVTYTPRATIAWVRARMEGATGDSIKVGIVSNAVASVTESALSTSYEYYFHTNDKNPDGTVAWTDAAIDALLLRYEAVIA